MRKFICDVCETECGDGRHSRVEVESTFPGCDQGSRLDVCIPCAKVLGLIPGANLLERDPARLEEHVLGAFRRCLMAEMDDDLLPKVDGPAGLPSSTAAGGEGLSVATGQPSSGPVPNSTDAPYEGLKGLEL